MSWNPAAFIDRPKDPEDTELSLEGFIVASADYIKSFDGHLKTISFTPVLVPVYEQINDDLNTAQVLATLFELSSKINSFKNDQIPLSSISSTTFEFSFIFSSNDPI